MRVTTCICVIICIALLTSCKEKSYGLAESQEGDVEMSGRMNLSRASKQTNSLLVRRRT